MDFQVHFSHTQSSDCRTITVTDTTGDYDAVTNPTGFGGINPAKTDVSAASLLIEVGTSSYTVNLFALGFPVTGEIALTALTVLGTDKWADGNYTFTLTVSGTFSAELFESSDDICPFLFCNSCCCVKQKWARGKVGDGHQEDRILASDLLGILKSNIECGELETAERALVELQKLCEHCGCS